MGIHLTILTPIKKLIDVTDVNEIYFQTQCGSICIMPGYAPMVTDLDIGVVIYTKSTSSGILRISGGLAQIEPNNTVTLFADGAEEAGSIDLPRAQRALQRAEALLATELSDREYKEAMSAKKRALSRIEAVEMAQNSSSKHKF